VGFVVERFELSERRSCRLIGIGRAEKKFWIS
jgi:hypothetical protein